MPTDPLTLVCHEQPGLTSHGTPAIAPDLLRVRRRPHKLQDADPYDVIEVRIDADETVYVALTLADAARLRSALDLLLVPDRADA